MSVKHCALTGTRHQGTWNSPNLPSGHHQPWVVESWGLWTLGALPLGSGTTQWHPLVTGSVTDLDIPQASGQILLLCLDLEIHVRPDLRAVTGQSNSPSASSLLRLTHLSTWPFN